MEKKFEFKPFDKVLVRDSEDDVWSADLFSHYNQDGVPITSGASSWGEVIPYEGNEKLLGTWDAYVEPYEPKDGDFVKMKITEEDKDYFLMIFHEEGPRDRDYCYACMYVDCEGQADNEVFINSSRRCNIFIPATEEEKNLLLSKLHEIGKDWCEGKKEIVEWKWKPSDDSKYYYVNSVFIADTATWTGNLLDEQRYKKGNCFRTHEEAQDMADKLNEAIKNVK